ncbi:hypothetical protein ACIBJI_11725 [Nocardia sp. NPDC050408]|uniref:hypothetical protein n=1 Tax=Nocardia sp. NPDC050408 TaxID=3364319 RepID=UPI00379FDE04
MSEVLGLVAALEIPAWQVPVSLGRVEGAEPGWAVVPVTPGFQGRGWWVLVSLGPELVAVLGIPAWRELVRVPESWVPGWWVLVSLGPEFVAVLGIPV